MYDPASFLELAPTMFYALEEDVSYKIPVIFVHGIGDSPLAFQPLLEKLDRKRFKPWFFYYPSGGDLKQLAELFYHIFISGEVIPKSQMPMAIVAHSMGGVVVREAINRYQLNGKENQVELFVSLASPFNGHPAAALGEKYAPLVLPSWRDLNPDSSFVKELFRKKKPDFLSHHLVYAFDNSKTIKLGKNSDGVVPLSSQLRFEAQQEASFQFGFDSTHAGVLAAPEQIKYTMGLLDKINNAYPDDHLEFLFKGGFSIEADHFSPITHHVLKTAGHYIYALVAGNITPISDKQAHFVAVIKGNSHATSVLEKELYQFIQHHPDPELIGE